MATYLLDGTGSARLPRRPLAVTVTISGNRAARARLTARLANGADAPVRVHSAGMLIVPRVEDEIVIVAVPDSGLEHFDENTVLHVTIGPDSPQDPDADYAQLAPREVSGLTSIELATLRPDSADQVAVTTRLAMADVLLPALASRARVACRGALGVDSLPAESQVTVSCVVDSSTSIAPLIADGTLAAATELVIGVAAVISGPQPLRTHLADNKYTEIPSGPVNELNERITAAIHESGLGVGADLEGAVARVSQPNGLTVVITDAATALGPPESVSQLVMSAAPRRYPGLSTATLPPPPDGATAANYYEANPQLVDQAVAAVVAPMRNRG